VPVRWATWRASSSAGDAARHRRARRRGEAAGGVIVMRSGKNALETIAAVKAKLQA
jgi:Cu/Ag efflux pump CusA